MSQHEFSTSYQSDHFAYFEFKSLIKGETRESIIDLREDKVFGVFVSEC